MKRGIFVLLFLLLCTSLSFSVSAAVINVPVDNATIQGAINNSNNGDTINVAAGTYNENVVVNKEVEIIGTNAVVNGASDAAFEIRADNVKIQGFNITTTGTFTGGAVEIYSSDNIDILENNIETSNAVIGIWICGSNNGCVSINNLDIKRAKNHEICELTKLGLKENKERYSTSHSKVGVFMLENDNKTIAMEIPVWLSLNEFPSLKSLLKSDKPLTGHIDLLRIEDGKLWVWDYKPNANEEEYAATQIFFYALMLNKRTGIPLNMIRCGYFDDRHVFLFKPDLKMLNVKTILDY